MVCCLEKSKEFCNFRFWATKLLNRSAFFNALTFNALDQPIALELILLTESEKIP